MTTPEVTDDTHHHEGVYERLIRYVEANSDTDISHNEQTVETVKPGTILYRTDGIVQQIDLTWTSAPDLVSALTTEIDDYVDTVNVYVNTRDEAAQLIETVYSSDVFRRTVVRIYVEDQGTNKRYIPLDDDLPRASTTSTAALQLFIDEFLEEAADETNAVTRDELYEQFSCWCRNVTGTAGPSRPGFGQLLAAKGIEPASREEAGSGYVLNHTSDATAGYE
ncbi:hypothetical protein [Natronosalvus halobius]|uniref:hypothetical protein n=1 Tax=Natronosalvus halobius TaxID=2953746 RepID=UPI00209F28B8|nr:hypothetical protein [Natronosalvus halobius]USZ71482.1 hypothetical protein NGM15_15660 [Natronosalvus halobius]